MNSQIRVAILDDHQSIIDGYTLRLAEAPRMTIVATALHGNDLDAMLERHTVDVLFLDVSIPTSEENRNPFPVLHHIPTLLKRWPDLSILIISMYTQNSLIAALVRAGASGYVFKDDQDSIRQLPRIVEIIAKGGSYFSPGAEQALQTHSPESILTRRQLEALSLCAAHPECDTQALANELKITASTLRNLLSGAYLRLGVRTRAAALAKAHQLGIFPAPPVFTAAE